MSVYFKFNSELNYSYVDFDGLHISVFDLKKAILHQKRLGKSADFDLLVRHDLILQYMKHRQIFFIFSAFFLLQISNDQTKKEYKDDQCLIPKNTSLIVARIPISNQNKKSWEIAQTSTERAPPNPASTENINHDISRMNLHNLQADRVRCALLLQGTFIECYGERRA